MLELGNCIFSAGLIFVSENIIHYNISNSNKTITKTTLNDYEEGVFLSTTVVSSPVFSVRIVTNPGACCICIGVAFNKSHFTQDLRTVGWCIYSASRTHYALGVSYQTGATIQVGQNVTVLVDVALKQISYQVNGVSAGPTRNLSLTDAQMQLLRPTVQIGYIGDRVEIIP